MSKLLFESNEWTFARLERTWAKIEDIAKNRYGLDYYPVQIEVISSEQMIENYATKGGMPSYYNHWSFGKSFEATMDDYKRNNSNLAYELVINTNPCIAYIMENNTMVMQATVLAHAGVGHNAFFKSNYLFTEHTNPNSILDYCVFAKEYIATCEAKYGAQRVEELLDACHALQYQSVDKIQRHSKNHKQKLDQELERLKNRDAVYDATFELLNQTKVKKLKLPAKRKKWLTNAFPEENLLYFIEKHSLVLQPWEKEIVRIVRYMAQYFYPQMLTKTMNEGYASFWHYQLLTDLFDDGYITEGQYMAFLIDHTHILATPESDLGRVNPYALGFNIFKEVKNLCQNKTLQDCKYLPDYIIQMNWVDAVKTVAADYNDASFIANFLTPKIIEKFKLAMLESIGEESWADSYRYIVRKAHKKESAYDLRRMLSKDYEWNYYVPELKLVSCTMPPKPEVTIVHKQTALPIFSPTDNVLKCISYFEKLSGFACTLVSR
jgi:stage V sporulation protein R